MCFSPQRRAIFRHQNFTKVLRTPHVLCIFTSECAFRHSGVHFFDIRTAKSAPELTCFVLYIFTSKCAFRHSGVQFLISPLSTYLRTRRFNRPTFRLTRHTNHWKNTAFRDFSNIWRGCIFFLLTFALLHLLSADLTTLLCFSTVHIVGSFYLNFLQMMPQTSSDNEAGITNIQESLSTYPEWSDIAYWLWSFAMSTLDARQFNDVWLLNLQTFIWHELCCSRLSGSPPPIQTNLCEQHFRATWVMMRLGWGSGDNSLSWSH